MFTGVDIVQISRIEDILDKKEESFLNRIFTKNEILYINSRGSQAGTIAGLYASKEAVSKALGTGIGQVSFADIEISHDNRGKPYVSISHEKDKLLTDLGISKFDLSISHDGDYAIAFVIAY